MDAVTQQEVTGFDRVLKSSTGVMPQPKLLTVVHRGRRHTSNENKLSHRWRRRAFASVFYFLISPL
jgi:hypothetical protein